MNIDITPVLELFIVRSQDGKFFRSIGYGGSGTNWVEDINKAKIYPRIGGARGRVTYFATNYPSFGIPDIIKLTVSSAEILSEGKE